MVSYDGAVHNSLKDVLQYIYGKVYRWSEVRWCLRGNSLGHSQQCPKVVQDICCEIISGLVRILLQYAQMV